jgi:hypothetical protein
MYITQNGMATSRPWSLLARYLPRDLKLPTGAFMFEPIGFDQSKWLRVHRADIVDYYSFDVLLGSIICFVCGIYHHQQQQHWRRGQRLLAPLDSGRLRLRLREGACMLLMYVHFCTCTCICTHIQSACSLPADTRARVLTWRAVYSLQCGGCLPRAAHRLRPCACFSRRGTCRRFATPWRSGAGTLPPSLAYSTRSTYHEPRTQRHSSCAGGTRLRTICRLGAVAVPRRSRFMWHSAGARGVCGRGIRGRALCSATRRGSRDSLSGACACTIWRQSPLIPHLWHACSKGTPHEGAGPLLVLS